MSKRYKAEQLLLKLYQARGKNLVFDLQADTRIQGKPSNTALERLAIDGFTEVFTRSTVVEGCEWSYIVVRVEGEELAIDLTQEGLSKVLLLQQNTLAHRTFQTALIGLFVGIVAVFVATATYLK